MPGLRLKIPGSLGGGPVLPATMYGFGPTAGDYTHRYFGPRLLPANGTAIASWQDEVTNLADPLSPITIDTGAPQPVVLDEGDIRFARFAGVELRGSVRIDPVMSWLAVVRTPAKSDTVNPITRIGSLVLSRKANGSYCVTYGGVPALTMNGNIAATNSDSWRVICATVDTASNGTIVNFHGVESVAGSTAWTIAASNPLRMVNVGMVTSGAGTVGSVTADVGEIATWSRALTSTERAEVVLRARTRFGVAA